MAHLVGAFRIGNDPVLRFTASNDPVISIALAFNYGRRDDQGNRPTTWVDAALWGKRAEALAPYLVKGQQIYAVLDDVQLQTYQRKDGGEGSKIAARVMEIELIGGKKQDGAAPAAQPQRNAYADARGAAQPPRQAQAGSAWDDGGDSIPF